MVRPLTAALAAIDKRRQPDPLTLAVWRTFLMTAGQREAARAISDPAVDRLLNGSITKADQTPGGTGPGDWGSEVAASATAEFFARLPMSAGAALISAGLQLPMAGVSGFSLPRRSTAATGFGVVSEDEPIPVVSYAFDAATLTASKLAVICAFSGELAKRGDGQRVMTRVLEEEAALSLDALMFSASAPGLLTGVTAVPGSGDIVEDVELAMTAVAEAGGSGSVAIIANPTEAAKIMVRLPQLKAPVWPSRAVSNEIVALDPTAFVSAFSATPDIAAAKSATLHMADDPAEIVSGVPVTADPVRSLWQTNAIALRCIVDTAFCMRAPAIAVVDLG
jgi:hypothetical protein